MNTEMENNIVIVDEQTTVPEVESVTTVGSGPITTTTQPRYKSWAMWLSILGAIGVILNATGVFQKIGLDNTTWDVIVNAIGAILIGFGILNNPTSKASF